MFFEKNQRKFKAELLFQSALRIVTANLFGNKKIPPEAISHLEDSIACGSVKSLKLLVKIILNQEHTLPNETRVAYLQMAANTDSEAAYEAATSMIGKGRFPLRIKDKENAWEYFYDAARLGHPTAFEEMMDAICAKEMNITVQQLSAALQNIVVDTGDIEVAFTFGSLLCGYTAKRFSQIKNLPIYNQLRNPDKGFDYLYYVVNNTQDEGAKKVAKDLIYKGLLANIFKTNPEAKEMQAKLDALKGRSVPSIS